MNGRNNNDLGKPDRYHMNRRLTLRSGYSGLLIFRLGMDTEKTAEVTLDRLQLLRFPFDFTLNTGIYPTQGGPRRLKCCAGEAGIKNR